MSTGDRKRALQQDLVSRILEGPGRAAQSDRRAAFGNAEQREPLHTLIDKVAHRPTQVTNEDIAAVKASGLTEDQIFELVVCAAVGQASRQYDTALQALAEATSDIPSPHRGDATSDTPSPLRGKGQGEGNDAPRDPQ